MVNMGETLPASGQAGTCARQGIDRLQVGDKIIMDGVPHIVESVAGDMAEIDRKWGRIPASPHILSREFARAVWLAWYGVTDPTDGG